MVRVQFVAVIYVPVKHHVVVQIVLVNAHQTEGAVSVINLHCAKTLLYHVPLIRIVQVDGDVQVHVVEVIYAIQHVALF